MGGLPGEGGRKGVSPALMFPKKEEQRGQG